MPVFLGPIFLIATAAAALPIVIHLLWKRQPKPMPFSTLRFLQEACIRTRRSRHLSQLLVLILRTLLLLLLALAFARPKMILGQGLSTGKRTLIIVMDSSASMRFRQADKTSFELAKDRAARLFDALDKNDKVGILAPGLAEPRIVYPPISAPATLLPKLRALQPGFGQVDLVKTLGDLVEHLSADVDRQGLELHVLSDFQAVSWPAANIRELATKLRKNGILLFLSQVRPAVVENAGVIKVDVSPPVVFGAGDLQAEVTVRESGDFSRNNTVALILDGQPHELISVQAVPGATQHEKLRGKTVDGTDSVMGRIELGQDAFELDNAFCFALPRVAAIPVVIVAGGSGETVAQTLFLQAAIQPGGRTRNWFQPVTQSWEQFMAQESEARLFLIANPPPLTGAVGQKLDRLIRDGATIVLFPGAAGGLTVASDLNLLRQVQVANRTVPQPESVSLLGTKKPSDLENRIRTLYPVTPTFAIQQRLAFTALPPTAVRFCEYPDGTPFMLELPAGNGRLWLSSLAADRSWSDWPISPLFLLTQQELLRIAAGRNQPVLASTVDGSVSVPWPENTLQAEFDLRSPTGKTHKTVAKRRQTADPFVITGFEEPGVYALSRGNDTRHVAVNLAPDEADLTYLPVTGLAAPLAPASVFAAQTWDEHAEALRLARSGRPLWPGLLTAALLVAVLEHLLANLRSRQAQSARPKFSFAIKGAAGAAG